MPSSDYSAVSSGALKLKSSGGVDKKKKKKKPKPAVESSEGSASASAPADTKEKAAGEFRDEHERMREALAEEDQVELSDDAKKELAGLRGKTEAERKFEEMRRKRLDERLKREGIKTHKERVEELNRYLSNLSEHHDMPRIGPG